MNLDHEYWRLMGRYFGYPKCCINEFIKYDSVYAGPTIRRLAVKNQTWGFVPCEKHAVEVYQGLVKLEDLITDRICPRPINRANIGGRFTYTVEWLREEIKKHEISISCY